MYIERRCTERRDWRTLDTGQSDRTGPREVAEALGVSLRTLEKRFRRADGRTILAEFTRTRIEHAKAQLEGSNANIPAIAHHSGFGSHTAMLRAFRQHVGMSPAAWRRQHGSGSGDKNGRL